jgi:S1/P1 Nuclease
MKRIVKLSVSFGLLLVSVVPVMAWGENGHMTVGQIASLRVRQHTALRIAQILKPGETLASVSTWADSVKEIMGTTDPDPDTNSFLQDLAHNERNREWHYDDLPLGCTSYQTCYGFTPDNDVVHMINVCIRTLQGNPDPNHPLSQRNALRLLVHFIGDMHQPLHIGSGYIDVNGPNHTILIATNPNVIRHRNLPNDRGGNQLIINNDRKRLHSYWDFDLVTALMTATNRTTPDALASYLRQTVPVQTSWNPQGPIRRWAAQWATDSLNQSRIHTYRSIRIVRERTIPVLRDGQPLIRDGQPVTEKVYDITRPNNYEALNREVVRRQLAKAGFRLAKLLDAIFAQQ